MDARLNWVKCHAFGKIVDIGCNEGMVFRDAPFASQVTGVDIDNWNPLNYGRFVQSDASSLPFADKEFDCAVCFPAGTIVTGSNVPIETLTIGDFVRSSIGYEQRVIKKFEHEFNGDIIKIKARGLLETSMTPEHPVLVTKVRRVHRHGWKRGMTHVYEYVHSTPVYKPARMVEKGDWVMIPRNKIQEPYTMHIRVLQKRCDRKKSHRNNKNIELNYDTALLLGLWTSEGSLDSVKRGRRFRFHFGSHETELIKCTMDLLSKRFGIRSSTRDNGQGSITVTASNTDMCYFLERYIGRGAHNKKVPAFIENGTEEVVRGFIMGCLLGDGDCNELSCGASSYRITTVSKVLSFGLSGLLQKIGVPCNIYKFPPRKNVVIKGIHACTTESYVVSWSRRYWDDVKDRAGRKPLSWSRVDEDYIYSRIACVSAKHQNIKVYNIETEDHTFMIPFIVHNCSEILEHVPDPVKVLKEAIRVARCIVISVPNEYRWSQNAEPFQTKERRLEKTEEGIAYTQANPFCRGMVDDKEHPHLFHQRQFTRDSLALSLVEAGLKYRIEELDFDEGRLGIEPFHWSFFLATAIPINDRWDDIFTDEVVNAGNIGVRLQRVFEYGEGQNLRTDLKNNCLIYKWSTSSKEFRKIICFVEKNHVRIPVSLGGITFEILSERAWLEKFGTKTQ